MAKQKVLMAHQRDRRQSTLPSESNAWRPGAAGIRFFALTLVLRVLFRDADDCLAAGRVGRFWKEVREPVFDEVFGRVV
jgi:hypothetical protein